MTYFRPEIEQMDGYTPGEQPQAGKFIKLNTNENPYPASPAVGRAIAAVVERGLGRYPDPMATAFRRRAAEVLGGRAGLDSVRQRQRRSADDRHAGVRGPGAMAAAALPQLHPLQDAGPNAGSRRRGGALSSATGRWATTSPRRAAICGWRFCRIRTARRARCSRPSACWNWPSGCPARCWSTKPMPILPTTIACELVAAERKDHGLALAEQVVCVGRAAVWFLVAQPHIIRQLIKVKDSYNCDALSIAGGDGRHRRSGLAGRERGPRSSPPRGG